MMEKHIMRLVMCVAFYGLVMGQQPQGSVLGQQTGPIVQQPRPLQAQRPVNNNLNNQVNRPFNNLNNQLNRPFNRPGGVVAQPQGPQIPVVEDIRDGPFHDGSYYFGYVSGDGSVREEGAVPTADGSFIVTGSYSYTAPNGELIEMQYISDVNGYRAFPKGSRQNFTPPQRILNAPPLPNSPFVNEFRPESRPILTRPQSFRPENNNLNNQVNRPFNSLNNQLNRPFNRPGSVVAQQTLGANTGVINNQATAASTLSALSAGVPDSEGSFSNNVNFIAEPIKDNDL